MGLEEQAGARGGLPRWLPRSDGFRRPPFPVFPRADSISRWLQEDRGRLRAAGLATRRAVRSSRPAKRAAATSQSAGLPEPSHSASAPRLVFPVWAAAVANHKSPHKSKLESNYSQAPFLCVDAQDAYKIAIRSVARPSGVGRTRMRRSRPTARVHNLGILPSWLQTYSVYPK